jgi:hypothetical protein
VQLLPDHDLILLLQGEPSGTNLASLVVCRNHQRQDLVTEEAKIKAVRVGCYDERKLSMPAAICGSHQASDDGLLSARPK